MKKSLLKLISMILSFVLLTSVFVPVYAEADVALKCADTVADGTINAKDALEVLKYAAMIIDGFEVEEEYIGNYIVGDVTGDYEINALDALDILKYSARIIDKFVISPIDANLSVEDIRNDLLQNIENDVTLGQYKGFEIDIEEVVITDEEVQEYIDYDLEFYGTVEEIKEGVVEIGDTISIDYVATIDSEWFEDWEENVELTIGEETFIEGFDDVLVGKSIGDTVVTEITFPEDYLEELAGKTIEFSITINYKYGEITPAELTDELVIEMGYGEDITTVEKYIEYVREFLEEDEKEMQKYRAYEDIMNKLVSSSTINNSDSALDVDRMMEEELGYIKELAAEFSISYEDYVLTYIEMSVDEFEALLREDFTYYVNSLWIYRAIAKAENITVSQEEYATELTWYALDYELYECESVEEFENLYGKEIYEYMLYDKVETYLYDSIVINYK